MGVIFIRGPKSHLGAVLDVAIFYCFFFPNWLEMTNHDKFWIKNNFWTPTQPRAGSEVHFYEGPGAILGVTLDVIITSCFCLNFSWK